MRAVADVERGIEIKVSDLGFELVELRWAGSSRRPILQLRVDRPAEAAEEGVNVDDCARISRELEPWLDEHGALSDRYVLEVSSPGVDRPLMRTTDFERFRGKRIAVVGKGVLLARSTRLEGELLGLDISVDGAEAVRLCLPDGDEVLIPRSEIRKTHLVFTWK